MLSHFDDYVVVNAPLDIYGFLARIRDYVVARVCEDFDFYRKKRSPVHFSRPGQSPARVFGRTAELDFFADESLLVKSKQHSVNFALGTLEPVVVRGFGIRPRSR